MNRDDLLFIVPTSAFSVSEIVPAAYSYGVSVVSLNFSDLVHHQYRVNLLTGWKIISLFTPPLFGNSEVFDIS
jgi:hypothetical protein